MMEEKGIKVRYLGHFSKLAGVKDEQIAFNGDLNIKLLIEKLSDIHGSKFKDAILDSKTGQIHPLVMVMVNFTHILSLDGIQTKIKNGDLITIMPPLAGGSKLWKVIPL